MGSKPLYVIRIMSVTQPYSGYYAGDKPWQYSSKDSATRLTHKAAHATMGKLKRLGYKAVVEPA